MSVHVLPSLRRFRVIPTLTVLGILQLAAVSLLYKNAHEFECDTYAPVFLCAGLSSAVLRAMCVLGIVALALLAYRDRAQSIRAALRTELPVFWLGVQFAGFILVLLPWTYIGPNASTPTVLWSFPVWITGGTLAAVGLYFSAFQRDAWTEWKPLLTPVFLIAAAIAFFAPEIARQAENIWAFQPISYLTFNATENVLVLLGQQVYSEQENALLAVRDFAVLVGAACAGMEGFALITGFLLFYFTLFRDQLQFSRVWFLIPVGLAISWMFNIVRIVTLMLIGAHISPDLAAGGFHSHAGWLMFTLVSLGMVLTVNNISWFRREADRVQSPREPLPFWSDLTTAQIFPFIVFMMAGLVAQTLFSIPDLVYPFRMGLVALVVILFWPALRTLEWRVDPISIGVGALIGVGWILVAPDPSENSLELATALEALAPALLIGWIICRIIGSALIVPVVEELFFRGYVFRLLDRDDIKWRALALAVSSILFGVMHGRWWEAIIAGFIYALLVLRTGRIADAIVAHAASNIIIAGAAAATGAWWII